MDSSFAQLIELPDFLRCEAESESGTIKVAKRAGTELSAMHRRVDSQIRSTRAYIRKLAQDERTSAGKDIRWESADIMSPNIEFPKECSKVGAFSVFGTKSRQVLKGFGSRRSTYKQLWARSRHT
ncbi:Uncharacterized protein TPAR_09099 [Tolypocladium paradoxum]|uniref:Uncharacterized protein n=1 Tax=Tolypocladium paradoxum TaxID=94208 RepID=A0A2S4LAU9_9HYPO|nr:Uncharacterized protein TPAR_09099 [Tolypocladium paradoxum]